MRVKIAQPQLPVFDWSSVDPESFRGPGLSFPTSIELIVAPSFNERVMGAMASFRTYYGNRFLLDPEGDGFQTQIRNHITSHLGKIEHLGESDLAIRMKFICNYRRVVIITIGTPEDLIVRH